MHNALAHLDDFQLVQRCLDGQPEALREIQVTHRDALMSFLVNKGALQQEAEELVSQLWADCLIANQGEIPRIARYDGSCKLLTWLNTVALNRLLTSKRRQQRIQIESLESATGAGEGAPTWGAILRAAESLEPEPPLVELLRRGIEAGFQACSPEQYVMLQLAHGDRLKLAELGQIWKCNPGTISRRLEEARSVVQKAAIEYVRDQDRWLDLTWDDFVQLCRSASLGALGFD